MYVFIYLFEFLKPLPLLPDLRFVSLVLDEFGELQITVASRLAKNSGGHNVAAEILSLDVEGSLFHNISYQLKSTNLNLLTFSLRPLIPPHFQP